MEIDSEPCLFGETCGVTVVGVEETDLAVKMIPDECVGKSNYESCSKYQLKIKSCDQGREI